MIGTYRAGACRLDQRLFDRCGNGQAESDYPENKPDYRPRSSGARTSAHSTKYNDAEDNR